MNRAATTVLLLATLLSGADDKGKSRKPPDVEILEVTAHRQSGHVLIDGRVRITSEKPLKGLVVLIDFLAPGRQNISTQKMVVSEDMLQPGDEAGFHGKTVDPVRAVHIRIHCEDTEARDLQADHGGPFPIE